MKIKKGKFYYVLNTMCIMILVGMIIYLLSVWKDIPSIIPVHFDLVGNIDRWGAKHEILILPVIACVMYVFITVIEQFPQLWNTGIKVTEENRERVYAVLLDLISTVKFIIVCMFTYLTVNTALARTIHEWFVPLFMAILFGDICFWMLRLLKIR